MNKTSRWVGIGVMAGFVFTAGNAAADQCTSMSATKSQWDWAKRAVQNTTTVLWFCQPCGEKSPKLWNSDWKNADLAYLYVQVGDDNFVNVARLVSCPVQSVPTFIDRGGKPH